MKEPKMYWLKPDEDAHELKVPDDVIVVHCSIPCDANQKGKDHDNDEDD